MSENNDDTCRITYYMLQVECKKCRNSGLLPLVDRDSKVKLTDYECNVCGGEIQEKPIKMGILHD